MATGVVALVWPKPTALVLVLVLVLVVVLSARPDIGAVTLALLFGLFSMAYGVSEIVVGVQMRRTGQTLQAVLHDTAA